MTGRPPAYGPVRRALGKVMDWAMGKEVVGKDAMGNVYFRSVTFCLLESGTELLR